MEKDLTLQKKSLNLSEKWIIQPGESPKKISSLPGGFTKIIRKIPKQNVIILCTGWYFK